MRKIAVDFEHCGIPCQFSDDLNSAPWEKLSGNITFNGLTIVATLRDCCFARTPAKDGTNNERNVDSGQYKRVPIIERSQSKNADCKKRRTSQSWREVELNAIWAEALRRDENKGLSLPSIRWLYETIREQIRTRDRKKDRASSENIINAH